MKNSIDVNHNDLTVIKHARIYERYLIMCDENRTKYPEVADYIARGYYYELLSDYFDLTPNYVCSIICKILNDEKKFRSELLRAQLNISMEFPERLNDSFSANE